MKWQAISKNFDDSSDKNSAEAPILNVPEIVMPTSKKEISQKNNGPRSHKKGKETFYTTPITYAVQDLFDSITD